MLQYQSAFLSKMKCYLALSWIFNFPWLTFGSHQCIGDMLVVPDIHLEEDWQISCSPAQPPGCLLAYYRELQKAQ